MIETLIEQIRATGTHLFSLTAMEDGNAQTFLFYPANPCNDTYSVAKVFTMTAIGLCFDCKIIKPSDKITDIFCAQLPAGIDPRWAEVTIDDVLRHRMGIAKGFLDIDVEDMTTYPSHDFLSLILRTKLDYAPGEQYCYSDAAYYLLSRVVTAVSGEGLDNLLMREILCPSAVGKQVGANVRWVMPWARRDYISAAQTLHISGSFTSTVGCGRGVVYFPPIGSSWPKHGAIP